MDTFGEIEKLITEVLALHEDAHDNSLSVLDDLVNGIEVQDSPATQVLLVKKLQAVVQEFYETSSEKVESILHQLQAVTPAQAQAHGAPGGFDFDWQAAAPLGVHFAPSLEDILAYLEMHQTGVGIPQGTALQFDVYSVPPTELPRTGQGDVMHFITPLRRITTYVSRECSTGTWKPKTRKQDVSCCNGAKTGIKTTLEWEEAGREHKRYIMEEYTLNQTSRVAFVLIYEKKE